MNKIIISVFTLSLAVASCKKFVEVGSPKNLIASSIVYGSDATAKSVMSGIYSNMVNGSGWASGGSNSVTLLAGLSADEFKNFQSNSIYTAFYTNSLSPVTFYSNLWSEPYNIISNTNALIEGLQASNGVTPAIANELIGEAKFIRAFSYFYLTNLFGDVPLVISTDYRTTALLPKSAKEDVYNQIITDLKDAQNLLANDYTYGNGERVVPNRAAATALLARVYFFKGDWANAEAQATTVIDNSQFQLETNLGNVFLSSSKEAIWQLKPQGATFNTNEGSIFIPGTGSGPSFVSINSSLLSAIESGDQRRIRWVDSVKINSVYEYFPSKYKIKSGTPLKEYSMVIRLAEIFLLRAESRIQLNKLQEGKDDLNAIRSRAGLGNTLAITKDQLLLAIQNERRIELFSEWGHRWLDLKRSGTVDAIMTQQTQAKGGTWSSYQQLYPIPQTETTTNPNLIQNTDY
jgi:hypothetical protein